MRKRRVVAGSALLMGCYGPGTGSTVREAGKHWLTWLSLTKGKAWVIKSKKRRKPAFVRLSSAAFVSNNYGIKN
jgi:hypothetical protein